MSSRWNRIAIPALALIFFVNACGSGSGGEEASADGAGSSDLQAQMQEEIESQLQRPERIGITEPVDGVPESKTIAVLQCRVPACATHANEIARVGEQLGWNVVPITTGSDSPEDIKNAWRAAIEMRPDGVVGITHDRRFFDPELAELAEMGIPVVRTNTVDEAGDGLTGIILGRDSYVAAGERGARYLLSQAGEDLNVLSVDLGDIVPTIGVAAEALAATVEEECPDCTVHGLTVPVTSIGGDLPQRIAAELRRNPDINYVAVGLPDMAVGLPAALNSAGLSSEDIGIITVGTPNEVVSQYMMDENYVEAAVSGGSLEQDWRAIDFFIRYFNGQNYEVSLDDSTYPQWIITKETIPGAEAFPLVEGYDDQFLKLWGVE